MSKEFRATTFTARCDYCGRHTHFRTIYTQHFNVGYDWEDSLSETICIWCDLKSEIRSRVQKIMNPTRATFRTLKDLVTDMDVVKTTLKRPKFLKILYKMNLDTIQKW